MENVNTTPTITTASRTARRVLSLRARAFAKAEEGSLIIFGLFMFCMMLAIAGLSFDLMRYESNRAVLQATTDRAALAAASLTQSIDPQLVVEDYFAKANLSEYLDDVTVTDAFGFRKVEVAASLAVPLHHGFFNIFSNGEGNTADTLIVQATSAAMEAIGNVEISMVLDVSGSMGSYSRLTNLKTAAGNFIDTVYGAAEVGTVSTNVVPYAEQVAAGPVLLSNYTLDSSAHTNSYCVNFSTSDFASTALSPDVALQQTVHFDPWSNYSSGDASSFDYENGADLKSYRLVCRTADSRRIMAWEEDPDTIKAHINSFYAGGNTSTDIGLKWGAALLDPGSQSVLSAMITSNDVDASMSGRPEPMDDGETMKVMVVMTDGENTYQHYMEDPYRSGDTAVYVYNDSGDLKYSIWTGVGEPDFDPEPECKKFDYKKGKCKDWGDTPENWYRVNDDQQDSTPYMDATTDPTRLSWDNLWATFPHEYFTNVILDMMGGQGTEINAIEASVKTHSGSTKNARMAAICTASKEAGITVFSVALDTNDNAATRLKDCASSPAHFYRVTGTEIDFAFQAIASQINQLRLVH